jgi:hypothetical protein
MLIQRSALAWILTIIGLARVLFEFVSRDSMGGVATR